MIDTAVMLATERSQYARRNFKLVAIRYLGSGGNMKRQISAIRKSDMFIPPISARPARRTNVPGKEDRD